ncbi:hypothetical protein HDU87_002387 [Geranomyces variabilis]|uniref:Uncharacterized protein n=1 Tax=Geranomyces variabilis TaxID=109894 RepID=A0AAD5TL20_9FUNG|nr:hypothetical protein HDU87_002387 [Geranomyces variabilis]
MVSHIYDSSSMLLNDCKYMMFNVSKPYAVEKFTPKNGPEYRWQDILRSYLEKDPTPKIKLTPLHVRSRDAQGLRAIVGIGRFGSTRGKVRELSTHRAEVRLQRNAAPFC